LQKLWYRLSGSPGNRNLFLPQFPNYGRPFLRMRSLFILRQCFSRMVILMIDTAVNSVIIHFQPDLHTSFIKSVYKKFLPGLQTSPQIVERWSILVLCPDKFMDLLFYFPVKAVDALCDFSSITVQHYHSCLPVIFLMLHQEKLSPVNNHIICHHPIAAVSINLIIPCIE